MNPTLLSKDLFCVLTWAEALTVSHTGTFEFSFPEGRKQYAFIYVRKGNVVFRFRDSDTAAELSRGQVIYIPRGTWYSVTYQPEQAQVMLLQFNVAQNSPQLPPEEPAVMPAAARRVYEEIAPQAVISSLRCAGKIYELLALLQQEAPLPQKYKRLLPAVEALRQDPTREEPVSYYAAMCHMSVPGFRRSFKEYTGKSPVEFRNELRLVNARKLIEQQECSVEAAARLSGFSNLSFFYRLFKRRYGTKPGSL